MRSVPSPGDAIARRSGVDLKLEDWDRCGRGVHTLLNLMPSGKYLMEDFFYAGGLPAVIRELGEAGLLHKNALTVNGETIWANNKSAPCWNRDVIHAFKKPFKKNTGIAVLRGNLCPGGAIIKPSAATPKLMKHRGRAVVFENIEDFHRRIDDPKLKIDAKSVRKKLEDRGYGVITTSARIDEAAEAYEALVEDIVVAAEIETTMRRLIEEIEKVKRRVNALEYRVIPELKATEAFIRQRLEEMERDNFMRLKRFKAMRWSAWSGRLPPSGGSRRTRGLSCAPRSRRSKARWKA